MKEMNTNTCEHVDDLVGFLYGELNELEARKFAQHLHECAPCKAEYTSLGQIRESLVEWRDESLGMNRAAVVGAIPSQVSAAIPSPRPGKSAWAAWREFFALSPLWLKGAGAFATVLFCICAVLAFAYVKQLPTTTHQATTSHEKVITVEELNQQVALATKLAIERTLQEQRNSGEPAAKVVSSGPQKPVDHLAAQTKPVTVPVATKLRRPFTQQERQELASDLRLVSTKDEDDLDLTGDSDRP